MKCHHDVLPPLNPALNVREGRREEGGGRKERREERWEMGDGSREERKWIRVRRKQESGGDITSM